VEGYKVLLLMKPDDDVAALILSDAFLIAAAVSYQ
jgi:hypothetical protein